MREPAGDGRVELKVAIEDDRALEDTGSGGRVVLVKRKSNAEVRI